MQIYLCVVRVHSLCRAAECGVHVLTVIIIIRDRKFNAQTKCFTFHMVRSKSNNVRIVGTFRSHVSEVYSHNVCYWFSSVFRAGFTWELKKTTSSPPLPPTTFATYYFRTFIRWHYANTTHRRHTSTTTQVKGKRRTEQKKQRKYAIRKHRTRLYVRQSSPPRWIAPFYMANERTNERSLVIVYLLATCQTCIVSGCPHSLQSLSAICLLRISLSGMPKIRCLTAAHSVHNIFSSSAYFLDDRIFFFSSLCTVVVVAFRRFIPLFLWWVLFPSKFCRCAVAWRRKKKLLSSAQVYWRQCLTFESLEIESPPSSQPTMESEAYKCCGPLQHTHTIGTKRWSKNISPKVLWVLKLS